MKRFALLAMVLLSLPSVTFAHVSVRPRESKAGAEERYTVRVPTEGTVATTHVQLEVPSGITVLEVLPHDGATFETAKQGDRITAITWRKEIAPKAAADFVFRAINPESGDVVWKAHQYFKDGTTADWVGPAGDRRPASVTKLTAAGGSPQAAASESSGVEAWLKGYDAAFNAKDLEKLRTTRRSARRMRMPNLPASVRSFQKDESLEPSEAAATQREHIVARSARVRVSPRCTRSCSVSSVSR